MKRNQSKKAKAPWFLKFMRWAYPKAERLAPRTARAYAVRLFFTPFRYPVPEKELKAISYSEQFTFDADGIAIRGYCWGAGEKFVLLVHGWAGRATQFRRFVKPLLAAGYKVVGFDGPAHGNSGGKTTTFKDFEAALQKIYEREGQPAAIIAHSYGGNAVLYSAMNGLPVHKLVNIASPTIGEDIVNTFSAAINASAGTKEYFYNYVKEKFGKPFDEFTALSFVTRLPKPIDLLLIHDEDDKEVSIRHPLELMKVYPAAKLFKTTGLGHTRILKDDTVIRKSVTFIQGLPST